MGGSTVSFVDALQTMLAVPRGGEGVVDWLQRLPDVAYEPARHRLIGRSEPGRVVVGKWRITPDGPGLLLELISAGIAVRSRRETGRAAASLVADIVDQHAATLPEAGRQQLEVERSVLCEVAAGSA
jgi:hypothetical protein